MEIKDDEGNSGEMKYIPVARCPKDARRAFGRNHIAPNFFQPHRPDPADTPVVYQLRFPGGTPMWKASQGPNEGYRIGISHLKPEFLGALSDHAEEEMDMKIVMDQR